MAAVHRRRQMRQHVERRVHEREVRERLREVSEQAPGLRVVFLREQTHVVRERQEPFEQRMRLRVPAEKLVAVDEPEGAREKDTLAGRQTVDARLACPIAEDEAL